MAKKPRAENPSKETDEKHDGAARRPRHEMVMLPPRPADLPNFQNPPIDEVILGVEFQPFPRFTQAHLGVLWNEIRADYPQTEDKPPLISVGASPIPLPFTFPPFGAPNGPGFRTWFVSQDDQYVLQVQNDRILHNWRRRTVEYPRFESLFELFYGHLQRFQQTVEEFGPISPKQIEITYVNWVTDMQQSDFFLPAKLPAITSPEVGDSPTQQQWSAIYAVEIDREVTGTLNIACGPGVRPLPVLQQGTQLVLTLKIPIGTTDGIEELMAIGRNIIVRTFTDLTTEEGHDRWGRIQS